MLRNSNQDIILDLALTKPIQFSLFKKAHGFEFSCHNYENNLGPKADKTAPRIVGMTSPKMDALVRLTRCRLFLCVSPRCNKRSISFRCEANIFFSFGSNETSPRVALMVASEIDLKTLSGLFAIIFEIISWCLQLARYLVVLLSLGFFFLGAICPPFYTETGK